MMQFTVVLGESRVSRKCKYKFQLISKPFLRHFKVAPMARAMPAIPYIRHWSVMNVVCYERVCYEWACYSLVAMVGFWWA